MRNGKRWYTSNLLQEALSSPTHAAEYVNGESYVSVYIAPSGLVYWTVNGRTGTEESAANVLARWAIEGV